MNNEERTAANNSDSEFNENSAPKSLESHVRIITEESSAETSGETSLEEVYFSNFDSSTSSIESNPHESFEPEILEQNPPSTPPLDLSRLEIARTEEEKTAAAATTNRNPDAHAHARQTEVQENQNTAQRIKVQQSQNPDVPVLETKDQENQTLDAPIRHAEVQRNQNRHASVRHVEVQTSQIFITPSGRLNLSPEKIFSDSVINVYLSESSNPEGLNSPDLPIDFPTVGKTRLRVPESAIFRKEGKVYKGKFAIKNNSIVYMSYRVYATDCVSILTKPELGFLEPGKELHFDAICAKEKLLGEEMIIFGFPIYSSRHLNYEALNHLWKAFRTAYFPEKLVEGHHIELNTTEMSPMDEMNVFQKTKLFLSQMFTTHQEEKKPIDWPSHVENTFNLAEFKRFWTIDSEIWRNLLFVNAEMNWKRSLAKMKADQKEIHNTRKTKIFIFAIGILLFAFSILKLFNWFKMTPPPPPKEPEGWIAYLRSKIWSQNKFNKN